MRNRLAITVLTASILVAGAYGTIHVLVPPERATRDVAIVSESLRPERIVCTGMVEATGGQIDVCAQIPGQLAEVCVREGESVSQGQVLAVVEAARLKALVDVAKARVQTAQAELAVVEAGAGDEEEQEARLEMEATSVRWEHELARQKRFEELYRENATSYDKLDEVKKEVGYLRKKADSLKKHYEALCRGPLPEEVAQCRAKVAEAESRLQIAEVNYNYRTVRAPTDGVVVKLHLHQGDSVSIEQITPIVRLVDADSLRIRLEIDESSASRLTTPLEGTFTIRGAEGDVGALVMKQVIPQFGPKRLYNPDTSARLDTRTLCVLCEIRNASVPLYPGQRVTGFIPLVVNKHDDATSNHGIPTARDMPTRSESCSSDVTYASKVD